MCAVQVEVQGMHLFAMLLTVKSRRFFLQHYY